MVAVHKALLAAAAAQYAGYSAPASYSGSPENGSVINGFDWGLNHFPWRTAAISGCSLTIDLNPHFPPSQTQLVEPTKLPQFLGLAFGVQNYTCSNTNTFTHCAAHFTEALAQLQSSSTFSCIAGEPEFATIQHDLYNFWNKLVPGVIPIQAIIDLLHFLNPPTILAQHYIIKNPVTGEGVSPVWDFTSSRSFQGVKDAFIVANGKGTIPAPTDPTKDVPWLDVVNVHGKIADEVFRYDTVGGQPPASCKYGQDKNLSVNYVSKYAFYGDPESPFQ